jgi:hypothetical protein
MGTKRFRIIRGSQSQSAGIESGRQRPLCFLAVGLPDPCLAGAEAEGELDRISDPDFLHAAAQ